MLNRWCAFVWILLSGCGAIAQETRPVFEIASVKPSPTVALKPSLGFFPGGRMVAKNATLKYLLLFAWNVRDYQVSGGPKWLETEQFDIEAKPAAAYKVDYDARPFAMKMLQTLLEDRFQLKVRRVDKDLPYYALVVGKDGSKLTEKPTPDTPGQSRMGGGKGLMTGEFMRMDLLAESLSFVVGRTVKDETGLHGWYDFRLEWAPDEVVADSDNNAASIFTAIQSQLGLKLDTRRGPVEALVIDGAEMPSAN